ncbi:uncharacterized protein I303_104077 [Kwoniella dejecticola CBS 10117]|uniref:POT family proton-dependent oligopeptide transporter n=1 Tax=Kwoniella dejecticola CBS 10117 TaxID=1296121 RepID=A0A1A6A8I7_9TREE|nr:uncharacterized protein I303_04096 [Kwoniella dejecticola CBS 10117]OBR86372.1 hypothetical protein I303_04096 [Kwoniella dejecticola CBS 10117]
MFIAAAKDADLVRDFTLTGGDANHILTEDPRTGDDKHVGTKLDAEDVVVGSAEVEYDSLAPTEEEKKTLRKVSGKVNRAGYALCFVEAANYASYYGVTGVFQNFIQRPLPEGGNGAGAPPKGTQQSAGALNMGLQTATALTVLFQFMVFCTPLLGGYLADVKLGRYKGLWVGIIIGFSSHMMLVIASIPSVIAGGHAIIPFIIGMICLSFGSGFIKPSVAPLIADQSTVKKQTIKVLASGERVIEDPGVTVERMLLLYYWAGNFGAFFSIATSYCEKRIGFWLSFMLPGICFLLQPLSLLWVRSRITHYPPSGSSVGDAFKVVRLIIQRGRSGHGTEDKWESIKPTNLRASGEYDQIASKHKAGWISFDDQFVDEVKATLKALRVFVFLPAWYLADGGTDSILTNLAGSMTTNGLPNDVLNNFNPIATVCAIPVYNYVLYPTLRKMGINFGYIKRIFVGFFIGAILNAIAAILQWRVYETSPCGYAATECDVGTGVSSMSAWLVAIPFILQPLGGIFISVSCYEMAYTMTPPRMKGTIIACVFFTSAISRAILLGCTPAFKDPNITWVFVGIGCANLLASVSIYFFFRDLDINKKDTDLQRMELTVEELERTKGKA